MHPTSSIGLLLSVVGCAICGCDAVSFGDADKGSEVASDRAPLTVEVVRVKEVTDDVQTVVLYGRLSPRRQATLRFQKPGRVGEVLAKDGEKFSAGDVLATLEQTELVQQRDELTAQIQGLQSQLASVPESQRSTLRQRGAQLRSQQQQLDATIAAGTIVAPFDCRVHVCKVTSGDEVSPAVSVVTVFSEEAPLLSATMDESTAGVLTDSQKYWVAIADQVFECRRAASDSSENNSWTFEFSKPLPEEYWLFQDVVEMRYRVRTGLSGFWLPLGSLRQNSDQRWTVLVADLSDEAVRVAERVVSIERMTSGFVLVTGDLADEDSVVASGGHRIVSGQQVTLSESRLEWSSSNDLTRPTGAAP